MLTGGGRLVLLFFVFLLTLNAFSQIKIGEEEKILIETDHPYFPAYTDEFPVFQDFIWFPGASYIKIHFSKFDLGPGDYVIVRSEDKYQHYRYEGKGKYDMGEFYATHIKGDLAIIELYAAGEKGGFGFVIDSYGRGYTNEEYFAQPEAVCGSTDWKNAKCYSGTYYERAKAVIRLHIGANSACTGWLVGCAGHLFTNNHCISNQSGANNTDYEFMGEGSTCNTNCDSWMGCPGTIWSGSPTFIQTDATLDYTLIQLSGNPQNTYGYLQLRQSGPVLNEAIYIPQHPNAWGKKIAIDSDQDSGKKCIVNALNYNNCYVQDIGYYCDTAGGSSGSPVIADSDDYAIALHHCGSCMNSGTPIDDIISDLGSNLPPCAVPGGCTPPSAPTGLAITGNCNSVSLSWNSVSEASGYNVYRYTGTCTGATFAKIGTTTSTTYTDSSVSAGLTYAYVVRAYAGDDTCESGNSNCVSTTVQKAPSVPAAPTVTDCCAVLIVSWSASSGSKSYNVYRRNGGCGSGDWSKIASRITETTYIDKNVMPNGTYGYSIEAENDCGTSTKSECSSGTHAAPDISGIVKEIIHNTITGQTTTEYIAGVTITDLTYQLNPTTSLNNGSYYFFDVQGSTYQFKACRTDWLDGEEYQVCYNPLPYRTVNVCKQDVPNQNFWLDVFVIPLDGRLPLPIKGPPIILGDFLISAYSPTYFKSTFTNSEGYYQLLLPSGIYKIVSRKDCYTTYPPYITQTVSNYPISNINFQIIDWQVCDNCYATLYREQKDCGFLINPEECLNNSILKFKQCVYIKTKDANSNLFNAIILSIVISNKDISSFLELP